MNTPSGKGARTDEGKIRAAAVQAGVPCVTTLEAATAAVLAIEALRGRRDASAGAAGSIQVLKRQPQRHGDHDVLALW